MYYGRLDANDGYLTIGRAVILSDNNTESNCWSSFYSYSIPYYIIGIENHYNIAKWCDDNCSGAWLVGRDESAFVDGNDATAFKLMWL
jgi:hypothetical protein